MRGRKRVLRRGEVSGLMRGMLFGRSSGVFVGSGMGVVVLPGVEWECGSQRSHAKTSGCEFLPECMGTWLRKCVG